MYRDENKCREKWLNYLDPTINFTRFTTDEDTFILTLATNHQQSTAQTAIPWSQFAQYFPGRLDSQILVRYKQLIGKKIYYNIILFTIVYLIHVYHMYMLYTCCIYR